MISPSLVSEQILWLHLLNTDHKQQRCLNTDWCRCRNIFYSLFTIAYAYCFKWMEVVVSVAQMKIKAGGMNYLNSPDQNKLEWNLSCSVCGRYCLSNLPPFTSSNASQRSFLEISVLPICSGVVFPVFQHACKTSCIPFSWLSVSNRVLITCNLIRTGYNPVLL